MKWTKLSCKSVLQEKSPVCNRTTRFPGAFLQSNVALQGRCPFLSRRGCNDINGTNTRDCVASLLSLQRCVVFASRVDGSDVRTWLGETEKRSGVDLAGRFRPSLTSASPRCPRPNRHQSR